MGTPPGNDHDHDVGVFKEASVNVTLSELHPVSGVPLKSAIGALIAQLPAVSATIAVGPQALVTTLRLIISLPPAVSLMGVSVRLSVFGPMA